MIQKLYRRGPRRRQVVVPRFPGMVVARAGAHSLDKFLMAWIQQGVMRRCSSVARREW